MFKVDDYVYVSYATDVKTGTGYSVHDLGHVVSTAKSDVVVELADGTQHNVCNLNVEKM